MVDRETWEAARKAAEAAQRREGELPVRVERRFTSSGDFEIPLWEGERCQWECTSHGNWIPTIVRGR